MVRSLFRFDSRTVAAVVWAAVMMWPTVAAARGEGLDWLLADVGHDTPTTVGRTADNNTRPPHREHRSDASGGSEQSLQLQWGRTTYRENLPQGIWNPTRALSSQADLDWAGSRVDASGFVGSTTFRYGLAAQYRKSSQGLEQWWDGTLLYQKNQLEFQAVQFEGSLGWFWDYRALSGEIMAEAVGLQEDQYRSWNVGQSPFSVERIRSAWVGIQGNARLPLADGVDVAMGGSWDYTPWNRMTNSVYVSNTGFRSTKGRRWQAWVGFEASGQYALGPVHLALVVGMSEMKFDGDLSGRSIVDNTGATGTAYWPSNTHKTYGVGMTLTWSPGQ